MAKNTASEMRQQSRLRLSNLIGRTSFFRRKLNMELSAANPAPRAGNHAQFKAYCVTKMLTFKLVVPIR